MRNRRRGASSSGPARPMMVSSCCADSPSPSWKASWKARPGGSTSSESRDWRRCQWKRTKQGYEKDHVQLAEKAILVGGRDIAQIEVVGLREPQQDLRCHRALIALDQVDVAGRDPEPLGDLGLRQPQFLPDPPET